ncbi:MAG: O-antigen ligase domain-containing protein [Methylococcus sp.]|nr:MAG: O-antigen ligase domain-containing protein [Methylococcus sp.]
MVKKSTGLFSGFYNNLHQSIVVNKFDGILGYSAIIILALILGYQIAGNYLIGGIIVGIFISLIFVFICYTNPWNGFVVIFLFSFFGFHLARLFFSLGINIPTGLISDFLIYATFLGLFKGNVSLKDRVNDFTKNSVIVYLLIIYGYFAIQVFNPNAFSFDGWFQGFRKILSTLFLLFISFNVFDSVAKIKKYVRLFFISAFLVGLYGCIQEWFGLFDFEIDWLYSDPHGVGLAFIDGDFRKFSTMSDPAAFSISMAASGVFFLIILTGIKKKHLIFITVLGISLMLTGMSYSGTRTANVMVVAGIILYILLTINQRSTWIFTLVMSFVFIVLMYGPFYNPTIARFRTTFSFQEDPSYNVREMNRKSIQFYIHSHPIGGGIGTTGGTGKTYHPGHRLAGFQPDNGYLKKALEIGPIGLINYLVFYFLILMVGINGFFSSKDVVNKILFSASICTLYCLFIGEYAQKALGQISDMVIFYPIIAIMIRLRKYESIDEITKSYI